MWARSSVIENWIWAAVAGSFGLILFRPHYWVFGASTTLVAWLMQDDLLWAPRFAQSLAVLQIASCLGLASVWSLAVLAKQRLRRRGIALTLWLGWSGIVLGCLWFQLGLVPQVAGLYQLALKAALPLEERAKADQLFSEYWKQSSASEPVICSRWLFRYARYPALRWYDRLRGQPAPEWILWDRLETPLHVLWSVLRTDVGRDVGDYREVGQNGRFHLYRRKSDDEIARERATEVVPLVGESFGQVRLVIRIAEGRAGLTEPLLSVGPPGRGCLFFLCYSSDRELRLGFDAMGTKVLESDPVAYTAGERCELELYCGALLPSEAGDALLAAAAQASRIQFSRSVLARWNGRLVLNGSADLVGASPDTVRAGLNAVGAGSAGERFTGTMIEAVRGGLPDLEDGDANAVNGTFGAARLLVTLPTSSSGTPEPLVVVGTSGDAHLAYLRMLADDTAKLGIEAWGYGVIESDPVKVEVGKPVEIVVAFPALFPPESDVRWGTATAEEKRERLRQIRFALNGSEVLAQVLKWPQPRVRTTCIGLNPVGGSWVGAKFAGRVLQVQREPITGSPGRRSGLGIDQTSESHGTSTPKYDDGAK